MNRARRRCMDAAIRRRSPWAYPHATDQPGRRTTPDGSRETRIDPPSAAATTEEWFASPKDVPTSTWSRSGKSRRGSGFECRSKFRSSPCAAHVRETAATEHGAAILFDLASRRLDCRCDILMALLDRQPTPDGRTR